MSDFDTTCVGFAKERSYPNSMRFVTSDKVFYSASQTNEYGFNIRNSKDELVAICKKEKWYSPNCVLFCLVTNAQLQFLRKSSRVWQVNFGDVQDDFNTYKMNQDLVSLKVKIRLTYKSIESSMPIDVVSSNMPLYVGLLYFIYCRRIQIWP